MPKEHEKIDYLPGEKSLKASFIVYADLECLLKKTTSCQNNPEKSHTEKKPKHKPSGYACCSICLLDNTKNKHYFYRGKYCIEKFCKDLKNLGTEINNFKEKEMIPLTDKDIKSYEKQKVCHICKKEFRDDDKNKKKVRDYCHYTRKLIGAAHNKCNLRFNVPKKIPIVFYNDSSYDYHSVIKKLAEEFKGEFECFGENTEKYIIFSVPLKKKDDGKITYKLKFIDSYRFMQTSLSSLVDNLSEVYDKECKKCMERKKIKINCEFLGFKNGRLNYKCKECKK